MAVYVDIVPRINLLPLKWSVLTLNVWLDGLHAHREIDKLERRFGVRG